MNSSRLNPWWIVAAAFLILGCNMGVRLTTGLLLPEISLDLSIPTSELALGFGVQNLLWGAVSPIAGMMAERYGTAKILLGGAVVFMAGMFWAALTESSLGFFMANAVFIGIGVGATTFPIVLGVVGRRFPANKRTFALGITSAGGSLGQFVYAVLLGQTDAFLNWSQVFMMFGASLALIILACWFMRDQSGEAEPKVETVKPGPLFNWQAVGDAFQNRSYQLLNVGFFVCGFHIAMLTVHMSGVVSYCGLPPEMASNSLAVIGLANVVGVIAAGWAGDRWHKPWLLLLIYWLRGCLLMALVFVPMNSQLFYTFSVIMGVLWLSTVPLTSGTVAQIFGTKNLASLFGFVMFSHQIGAFFGSWWGGLIFDSFGSYHWALLLSAALGILAAVVHLPITPKKLEPQLA
ncbi:MULTISPECIES: MFS transporter [unclassified Neptuniibacter]|uniref:MFS transporter n=1 Tax=unclassified Neptuniibacter TaxID=2630693 RepID=UPI000C437CC3|nr:MULTISPECIES: MFS transporter [unclassified Neptuniibacter]MAY41202.1 MFS transporter [Oceanospirillaceae bacterium]|tara:strand:+ start:6430 stop:7644 length:1215 start_codon:yes stop_codon:yes gene_type:complete